MATNRINEIHALQIIPLLYRTVSNHLQTGFQKIFVGNWMWSWYKFKIHKNMYKNAELYGIDKNINVLSIASTFIKTQLSNIENMNLEYEKEFFDFILVGNILQQFRNPQDIIKYLESFLNNKGKLLIGGLDSGILL